MSDKLLPCPFCGNEHPEIVSGDGVMCGVPDCYGSNMFDQWQRRTPGPATKAMLREVVMALREGWGESVINQGTMEDFLREWDVEMP